MRFKSSRRWSAGLALLACGFGIAAALFAQDPGVRLAFVVAALAGLACTWGVASLRQIPVWAVLAGALVLRLAWLPVGPVLSDDAYRYLWDGELVAAGENPYLSLPEERRLAPGAIPRDSLNSAGFYSVYPPASQWAFSVAARMADWPASYFLLKGLLGLAELAGLLLLLRLAAPWIVVLYAWHPVVVIASTGQGHTEALAVPFLVGLVWAARHHRDALVGALVAMASLVKLVPLLVAPMLVLRGRWGAVGVGTLVGLVVAWPFLSVDAVRNAASSLELYVRYFEFNAGPYYAVKGIMMERTGIDWSKQIGPAFRTLFLWTAAGLYATALLRRVPVDRLLLWLWMAFLLLSTTIHPWYFVPVLALLAAQGRPGAAWQWLAGSAVGTYLLYTGGPYWLWVWIGWCGFTLILLAQALPVVLTALMSERGRRKAARIRNCLGSWRPGSVIDIGAGEGHVARALASTWQVPVRAEEVDIPPNASYAVQRIGDETADLVILAYVLHHTSDPEAVLRRALERSTGRLVILESVVVHKRHARWFASADRFANGIRGLAAGRGFRGFRAPPSLRTAAAWRRAIVRAGARIESETADYRGLHHSHLFCVRPEPIPERETDQ